MKSTRKLVGARVVRERENLETMVRLFCHCQHHGWDLCPECKQLLEYSSTRLERCRLGPDKPACDDCFQCYTPACRKKIKTVIEATHSRMLWHHPQMALRHWLDSFHHPSVIPQSRNYSSWGSE